MSALWFLSLLGLCSASLIAIAPIPTTLNVWTVGPQSMEGKVINVGDTIAFAFATVHNVVFYSNRTTYTQCNTNNATYTLVPSTRLTFCPPNVPSYLCPAATGYPLNVNWTATTPGEYYIACRIGRHCEEGMKFIVTVVANDANATAQVYWAGVKNIPFWTVGPQFAEVVVTPNDTLAWVSTAAHNLVEVSNVNAYNACNMTGSKELISAAQFASGEIQTLQLPIGVHYLACGVLAGGVALHCQLGQHITVRVEPYSCYTVNFGSSC